MEAIIYTSNTGNTEKYAQMLSQRLGKPCYSLQKAPDELRGKEIIYMGWVMAAAIQGLEQAKAKYTVTAVCAVGMAPKSEEKNNNELIKKNNITVPFYYLPGGFSLKKLSGMYKMMMGMILKKLESEAKKRDDISEKELELILSFKQGADFVNESNLDEITAALTE